MRCAFFAGKLDQVNKLNIEIAQLCREYVYNWYRWIGCIDNSVACYENWIIFFYSESSLFPGHEFIFLPSFPLIFFFILVNLCHDVRIPRFMLQLIFSSKVICCMFKSGLLILWSWSVYNLLVWLGTMRILSWTPELLIYILLLASPEICIIL